jgi:hypothetical protein
VRHAVIATFIELVAPSTCSAHQSMKVATGAGVPAPNIRRRAALKRGPYVCVSSLSM